MEFIANLSSLREYVPKFIFIVAKIHKTTNLQASRSQIANISCKRKQELEELKISEKLAKTREMLAEILTLLYSKPNLCHETTCNLRLKNKHRLGKTSLASRGRKLK